jgi:hypothetical protein
MKENGQPVLELKYNKLPFTQVSHYTYVQCIKIIHNIDCFSTK